VSDLLRNFRRIAQVVCPMDFIEKYLGFSPDHGDGSLEAFVLIALAIAITGLALRFFRPPHVRK
jgi:hypothetical protein